MKTNKLHQVIITEDDMIEVLYRDEHIDELVVEQGYWVDRFNKNCEIFDLPFTIAWTEESELTEEEFVARNLSDWSLPVEFEQLDIENYLLSKCKTQEQRDRVILELDEFKARDMMTILRWMAFFVATLRENQMIWGVGRGSSVASYVLYLLDVHKVDSLKYNLDIKEFLK